MSKKNSIDSFDQLASVVAEEFNELHTWLFEQFRHVGNRFERVEMRLEHLEADNKGLKEGLGRIEYDVTEIKTETQAMSRAVDKDAEAILELDRRVTKIEHTR